MKCSLLTILLCLIAFVGIEAQVLKSDSLVVAAVRKKSIEAYHQSIRGQAHLFNGSQYAEYRALKDENPYFSPDWVEGSIYYDGEEYENVPMLYDIDTDNVITEYYYNGEKVQLIASKIDSFQLGKYKFVRLGANDVLKTGFYNLVYDGKIKFYSKREKNLQQKVEATEVKREFEEKVRYYILKDGNYLSVKSKGSVLEVFEDNKEEIKQFIRKNHLKFKKDRENDIALTVEFYDHIQKVTLK